MQIDPALSFLNPSVMYACVVIVNLHYCIDVASSSFNVRTHKLCNMRVQIDVITCLDAQSSLSYVAVNEIAIVKR